MIGLSELRAAFITVGDTQRLTGGYLYHARVFAALRARGIAITEVVAGEAPLTEQLGRAAAFGPEFDPCRFDVVVVDALARAVCAPWLDGWRALRPVVAMVHELPSVAQGNDGLPQRREDSKAYRASTEAFAPWSLRGEQPPNDVQRSMLALEAPLLRSDLLIAVSAHGRAMLEERGVAPERIRVVSPGCDRVRAAGRSEPAATPEAGAPLVALCVAQWIPRKGILTLVEAWASQPRAGARLELIGETAADPAYAAEVRAAIARAPAHAPIAVRGAVSDEALIRAYQHAAFFVLPSAFEGYGMAYAEALSFGLPIVACDTGPVPELVGDGGLLVPPSQPAALADAITCLLGDAGLRARMARAARRRGRALPTWEDTSRQFQGVLEEVTAARR